jgi:hypothetical protein
MDNKRVTKSIYAPAPKRIYIGTEWMDIYMDECKYCWETIEKLVNEETTLIEPIVLYWCIKQDDEPYEECPYPAKICGYKIQKEHESDWLVKCIAKCLE